MSQEEIQPITVTFPAYMPDGPGQHGDVHFEFGPQGERTAHFIAQTIVGKGDVSAYSLLQSPIEFCPVKATLTVDDPQTRLAIFERLPEAMQEWLRDAEGLASAHVQGLVFADGSQGAIVMGGEAHYVTVIAGRRVVDFGEGMVGDMVEFETAFELPAYVEFARCMSQPARERSPS